tara:strand:- start:181 stop:666 length:486 start_codon:yes stop_codon:yes gene_type:complete
MMENEFIPYEEARLLKGLGFNEPCLRYYWEGATELMGNNTSPKTNWELTDLSNSDLKGLEGTVFMTAPLYQQAFEWFRDRGYSVRIEPTYWSRDDVRNGKYKAIITNQNDIIHEDEVTREDDDIGYDMIFMDSKDGTDKMYDTYRNAELTCLKKLIELNKA